MRREERREEGRRKEKGERRREEGEVCPHLLDMCVFYEDTVRAVCMVCVPASVVVVIAVFL